MTARARFGPMCVTSPQGRGKMSRGGHAMYQKAPTPIVGSAVATAALDHALAAIGPETKVGLVQVVDPVRRFVVQTTPVALAFDGATLDAKPVDAVLDAQHGGARSRTLRVRGWSAAG